MRPRSLARSVVVTFSLAQLAGACDGAKSGGGARSGGDANAQATGPSANASANRDAKPDAKPDARDKRDDWNNPPGPLGDNRGDEVPPPKRDAGVQPRPAADTGNPQSPPRPEEIDPFKFPANQIDLSKGKRVVLQADGSCREVTSKKCKPGVHCNPPRPKAITCPKELRLPKATRGADVYKSGLQTCWQRGTSTCADGEQCDPPPSTRVVCPVGVKPG